MSPRTRRPRSKPPSKTSPPRIRAPLGDTSNDADTSSQIVRYAGRPRLASIETIPIELLSHIFSQVCGRDPKIRLVAAGHSSRTPASVPPALVLTGVCKEWQSVAKRMRQLWTRVEVDFHAFGEVPVDQAQPFIAALEDILQRSHPRPLRLTLHGLDPELPSNHLAADAVLKFADRYSLLVLDDSYLVAEKDQTSLTHLVVRNQQPGKTIQIPAPNLNHLSLYNVPGDNFGWMNLDYPKLTHLSLFYPSDLSVDRIPTAEQLRDVLQTFAKSLIVFRANLNSRWLLEGLSSHNRYCIELPNLHTLELQHTHLPFMHAGLLCSLSTPKLEYFDLFFPSEEEVDVSGEDDETDSVNIDVLMDFFQHESRSALKRFRICYGDSLKFLDPEDEDEVRYAGYLESGSRGQWDRWGAVFRGGLSWEESEIALLDLCRTLRVPSDFRQRMAGEEGYYEDFITRFIDTTVETETELTHSPGSLLGEWELDQLMWLFQLMEFWCEAPERSILIVV
ncbi:hypothetical protein CC2G_013625 [Coprinopsis cinerea AmutBmut pab1-1]|nr:hypothetical protein CC2G_013625 [Coprinopsis cinerea AmutBmut pab1-1]